MKDIHKFQAVQKGAAHGETYKQDHTVNKGLILPLMSSGEPMRFGRNQGILNKDYGPALFAIE